MVAYILFYIENGWFERQIGFFATENAAERYIVEFIMPDPACRHMVDFRIRRVPPDDWVEPDYWIDAESL